MTAPADQVVDLARRDAVLVEVVARVANRDAGAKLERLLRALRQHGVQVFGVNDVRKIRAGALADVLAMVRTALGVPADEEPTNWPALAEIAAAVRDDLALDAAAIAAAEEPETHTRGAHT